MIPFSPPHIDEKIVASVKEALLSGWITTGPRTKKFENLIAQYCGIDKVLCVNSASAGLELILRWFGVKEDDEVLMQQLLMLLFIVEQNQSLLTAILTILISMLRLSQKQLLQKQK